MDRAAERRRLAQRPNNVRFEELRRVFEAYGWTVVRTHGSHFLFGRGEARYTVPVHGGRVAAPYVRAVIGLTAAAAERDEREAQAKRDAECERREKGTEDGS